MQKKNLIPVHALIKTHVLVETCVEFFFLLFFLLNKVSSVGFLSPPSPRNKITPFFASRGDDAVSPSLRRRLENALAASSLDIHSYIVRSHLRCRRCRFVPAKSSSLSPPYIFALLHRFCPGSPPIWLPSPLSRRRRRSTVVKSLSPCAPPFIFARLCKFVAGFTFYLVPFTVVAAGAALRRSDRPRLGFHIAT